MGLSVRSKQLIGLLASCPGPKSNLHFFNTESYRNLGYLEAYCKIDGILPRRLPDLPPFKPNDIKLAFVVPPLGGRQPRKDRLKPELQTVLACSKSLT